MDTRSRSFTTDLMITLLGLIAALSLGFALLGQLWEFLPLVYLSTGSMVALHALTSSTGAAILTAPLGFVVSLPAGTVIFAGKMHRFRAGPLLAPLTVRVGWWQRRILGGDGGPETFYVFFHDRTRYALSLEAARDHRSRGRGAEVTGHITRILYAEGYTAADVTVQDHTGRETVCTLGSELAHRVSPITAGGFQPGEYVRISLAADGTRLEGRSVHARSIERAVHQAERERTATPT